MRQSCVDRPTRSAHSNHHHHQVFVSLILIRSHERQTCHGNRGRRQALDAWIVAGIQTSRNRSRKNAADKLDFGELGSLSGRAHAAPEVDTCIDGRSGCCLTNDDNDDDNLTRNSPTRGEYFVCASSAAAAVAVDVLSVIASLRCMTCLLANLSHRKSTYGTLAIEKQLKPHLSTKLFFFRLFLLLPSLLLSYTLSTNCVLTTEEAI